MLALERRNQIISILQEQRRVYVGDLARRFQVSEETIRRDLDRLDRDGIATKSYGGAVFNNMDSIDLPFNVRRKNNVPGKLRIAELAASLIEDGDHIFLDASTTAVYVAKAIREKRRLTVVTNSIENILELADIPDWEIISSGGRVKEGYLAFTGPKAVEGLTSFNAEKAFVSCKALSLERGLMEGNEEVTQTKLAMMTHAEKTYLMADLSKFDKKAFSRVCGFDGIAGVITDEMPPAAWLACFAANGIRLYCPEEKGTLSV